MTGCPLRARLKQMPALLYAHRRAAAVAVSLVFVASFSGCENRDAHITAPSGAAALSRFTVIGTDLSMGVASGGVLASTQGTSWPAIIAGSAQITFRQPLFKVPGCTPPLVAPLLLGRWLSGSSATIRDSSCAGPATSAAIPADNLSLPNATAYAALHFTPKLLAATPASYPALDRARYPLVLGTTQSQVTAMLVKAPTFVALELGTAEVLGAVTSGLLLPAATYVQAAPWTYVPAAVAAPIIAAIGDSIAKSAAKAVILSVPHMTRFPAFQAGRALAAQRTVLAALGVTVASNCDASVNVINVAAKIPSLVLQSITTGLPQPLSCADVPGSADHVLLPADVAVLDAAVDQINAQLKQLAQAHRWAFADLDLPFATMLAGTGPYAAGAHLTCTMPYGWYFSLDGLRPTAEGQRLIANAVALAINDAYRLGLSTLGVSTLLPLRASPCP